MVGDILLHDRVSQDSLSDDGSYDFSHIFDNCRDIISGADIALVNQEVIIGGKALGISGYPAFNAPEELAGNLVDAGFDIICHATNHALDKGKKGLLNCMDTWEKYEDIQVLGIHDSAKDQEDIFVYNADGFDIAILNYTYGTNGIALPSDMPYAVDLLTEEKVKRDLKRADEMADFTIVCPHWGTEYQLTPDSMQKKWTDIFLAGGADLVIGTHPHVLEPMEWVFDDMGNRMLVYYSLGNFVNWTSGTGPGTANRMVGGIAKVVISNGDDGVHITANELSPIICHVESGKGKVRVYPIDEYSETLASNNEIRKQDESFSYEYCNNLAAKICYN